MCIHGAFVCTPPPSERLPDVPLRPSWPCYPSYQSAAYNSNARAQLEAAQDRKVFAGIERQRRCMQMQLFRRVRVVRTVGFGEQPRTQYAPALADGHVQRRARCPLRFRAEVVGD